ncbi:hypothetical protein Ais01nite_11250 [Asanoa ishikariensis]|uniref:Uncharacterized protein n=1 Tax=Asanoa ishikariensis TaxID=137265 RepID=A0A1H3T393_9ACTN|nr:hypothetical protein [Asanoa ishikariensis]GIF63090.1 hypothetical protein Ais01nite_11250 [Asanoa ishikariensis]SDZ44397.1 hypothetical protein SAMN05421684_5103 [Asanoa ishikariensis]
MRSFTRVAVLFSLLVGAAGVSADPPWSLWLAGIALLVAAVALPLELRMRRYDDLPAARWSSYVDTHRPPAEGTIRVLAEHVDDEEFDEGRRSRGLRESDSGLRMRRKASRTAPASRRLRPPPAPDAYRAAFGPISDDAEDRVDTIAERIAQRMKWDALWWFLAAVAVSIPVGIFVNQIS